MISIDTNVLLRYLLQDDKEQSALANKLMESKRNVLIKNIVLTEMIWALKGKKYKLQKPELIFVVEQLFKEPGVIFEDGQTVWNALNHYRETPEVKVGVKKKNVDFADVLILEKSKYISARKHDSFDGLYTFDVAAQGLKGTKKM